MYIRWWCDQLVLENVKKFKPFFTKVFANVDHIASRFRSASSLLAFQLYVMDTCG